MEFVYLFCELKFLWWFVWLERNACVFKGVYVPLNLRCKELCIVYIASPLCGAHGLQKDWTALPDCLVFQDFCLCYF